jgi:ribosome-binding protein aMBF1 (putative translation factor)
MNAQDQLKEWIKENGIKKQWLAGKCFVNVSTLRRWINSDVIPGPLERAKLAELTGLDVAGKGAWL